MIEVSDLSVSYGKHRALDGMLRPEPGARATLSGQDLLAMPPHRIVEAGLALVSASAEDSFPWHDPYLREE